MFDADELSVTIIISFVRENETSEHTGILIDRYIHIAKRATYDQSAQAINKTFIITLTPGHPLVAHNHL